MAHDNWFNYESTNADAECNIFCFPHAGSGASSYAKIGKQADERFSFYPIQYPMRENRIKIKMPDSIKLLAEQIAIDNKEIFMSKKSIFYGHCYGAVVAFETILHLKEKYGYSPELLIAASSEAPGISEDTVRLEQADNEQVANFFINYGYMDSELKKNKIYMDFFMPILKNDYILLQRYIPDNEKKIDCPILAPFSPEDSGIRRTKVENWKNFTEKELIVKEVKGGHFFLDNSNFDELLNDSAELLQM